METMQVSPELQMAKQAEAGRAYHPRDPVTPEADSIPPPTKRLDK
jgi:hypothetical protein